MATDRAPGAPSPGRSLLAGEPADLALRLTLVALLLSPIGGPGLRPLFLALPAAGLLLPRLLRTASFWGVLALLAAARVILDWPLADNHAYLLAYWCAAIALSRRAPDFRAALSWNARKLVGLVFAFAALWKLLAPDYLDGSALGATMLLDARFEAATRWLSGLAPEALAAQRAVLRAHVDGILPGAVEGLELSQRFLQVSRAATVFALALEALVALAFLWPGERGPARLRDAALLVFSSTTYAVATVAGFGWLLLAMGVAQSGAGRPRLLAAYLAVFGLLLFHREVPWIAWLAAHAPLPA